MGLSTPTVTWVGSSPTGLVQWICREWVQELSFSEDCNNWTWSQVDWITNTWGEVWSLILEPNLRTNYSYCFFNAWLQELSRMILTTTVFPKSIFSIPLSWRVSYVIYLLLVDLGPPFVDYVDRYLSACLICCLLQLSVSCSNQGGIIQKSLPHQCGQIVSCGHLIRRWQLLLEWLLYHALMAGPLC